MSTINLKLARPNRSHWLIIFLLLSITAVAAVVWLAWPTIANRMGGRADTPQAVWQAQGMDSYRYTLTLSCFCPLEMVQPVTIEVVNGEVAAITYAETAEPADAALFEQYSSIDKLHTIIAEAEAQNPARLDVVYDTAFGVPLNVDIDISEMMADEEIRFTVTNFEKRP